MENGKRSMIVLTSGAVLVTGVYYVQKSNLLKSKLNKSEDSLLHDDISNNESRLKDEKRTHNDVPYLLDKNLEKMDVVERYDASSVRVDLKTIREMNDEKGDSLVQPENPVAVIIESKLVYLDTSNVFNIKTLNPEGDELVVFLGEEILANPEIGFNFNQQYVDKIKPDWYIPHPRARFQIEYDRILNSNLLFEDLVNEWQLLYSKIIVYHFSSSVSVHLNNIESIEFRGISCYPLRERQAEMEKYGLSFNKLDLDFKI